MSSIEGTEPTDNLKRAHDADEEMNAPSPQKIEKMDDKDDK